MPRACHISTVHDWFDNRIFLKECRSLRDAGYDVSWVVPYSQDENKDGIDIVALDRPASRYQRWIRSGWQALRKALRTNADVYHFHDPELIPQGLVLRLLGRRVIYDIHEDYVSSLSQKHYLSSFVRSFVANVAGFAESLCSRQFVQVIAERYYAERFPRATHVLNYPVIPEHQPAVCGRSTTRLLYTGKVHEARGAHIHASLPRLLPDITVDFIGRCSADLHQQLVEENPSHLERLSFEGVDYFVPYDTIEAAYAGNWLAGLAIFPKNEHLDRKELTKFFEFMLHGIPIIASSFPVWRDLIEGNECGICVDPTNENEIVAAIRTLQEDEELWSRYSRNGIAAVRDKYSWASQEQNLLNLYRDLVGDAPRQLVDG